MVDDGPTIVGLELADRALEVSNRTLVGILLGVGLEPLVTDGTLKIHVPSDGLGVGNQ